MGGMGSKLNVVLPVLTTVLVGCTVSVQIIMVTTGGKGVFRGGYGGREISRLAGEQRNRFKPHGTIPSGDVT